MRLRHLAILTAAATLALMVIGSLVHGTGSSLACPDWPLCHGTAFPAMVGGVRFEHTHRLVAAAVVVLTVALTIGAWRGRDRGARALTAAACALVALQATLGGLTVIFRLPPAISIAHLATSMGFLSVVVLIAVRLASVRVAAVGERSGMRGWTGAAALVVYAQIVLGGVVRHTGSALACLDMPLCAGSALPSSAQQWIHMAHRTMAVLAGIATIAAAAMAARRTGGSRRVIAVLPAFAVVAQIALGVTVVLAGTPLLLVTLHHAIGAVLLASLVLSWATVDARGLAATDAGEDRAQAQPARAG